jgi:ubiquinol-cytochrome c reductase cytochrome c subunit
MKRCALVALIVTLAIASSARMTAQATPPAQPAAAPPARAAQAPASNAEAGRKLFVSYGCYQCHGYEAQGSSATGPRLGPRPLPFAALSKYVRQPTNQMPPYTTKVLPDADLANIYAFLQSRPVPPAVDDIPLLK